jgi:hypothetical protein
MGTPFKKQLGLSAMLGVVAQFAFIGSASAVPSDKEAWRSDEHGIIVYRDAVEDDTYWFIPKIRFESTTGNKTLLRSKKLENGSTEYTVRIIPYFSKDLKNLAARNISNIRQDSQLKPVIAKSIGISLPDFGFKYASASVTSFQYLESPRLIKFTLPEADAATFDELYADDTGVNVDFTITYDGMMTDKFYNIQVSCKAMVDELSIATLPGTGVKGGMNANGVDVVLGLDIEAAFVNAVNNSSRNVNIVSKGDLAGMQEMIRRVVNLCFEKADDDEDSRYPYPRYPRRTTYDDDDDDSSTSGHTKDKDADEDTTTKRRGDVVDSALPRSNFVVSNEFFAKQSAAYKAQHAKLLIEKAIGGEGDDQEEPKRDRRQEEGGLLPEVTAKARFKIKKTMKNDDRQAVAKQIALKDTTSTAVLAGYLSANAKRVETVQVKSIIEKQFSAKVDNTMAAPLRTGITVKSGEQWTINAAFIFNARTSYSPWKAKQYAWDANWPKTDGDLYFRVGTGHWTPVNGRNIIESGLIGEGELQFYVDKSAIFNKIPADLRKSSCLGLCEPMFKVDNISPEFTVQISGRQINVR